MRLSQLFSKTLRGPDRPKQVALGICLGMCVGLLPKDSACCYLFIAALILSNANLLAGILSGLAFSLIGTALDEVAHSLGAVLLTFDPLENFWIWFQQLPLSAWTRLENTVVVGLLAIALLAFLPVYKFSHVIAERYGVALTERLGRSHFVQWLIGSPGPNLSES